MESLAVKEPPRTLIRLTQISLMVSSAAALTWFLASPSDPHDDPRFWVGFLTFVWHFLLSPIVNFGLLVTASILRKRFQMRTIALGAVVSLFLPFMGQIIGGIVWGAEGGPLSVR